MSKVRLDVYLVEKGFCPSRTKAQDSIKAGLVTLTVEGQTRTVLAPSEMIDDIRPPQISVQKSLSDKYVSRGGVKLEGALSLLQLGVEDFHVLDIGLSTGGFTDCLLQRGARHVVGVDVGHNQLAAKLKSDPRLKWFEGVNAREINKNLSILAAQPEHGFDLVVIDVSFISLTLILPGLKDLIRDNGAVLALVKPQFEVGPEGLGKGGIVRDEKLYGDVFQKIEDCVLSLGGRSLRYFESEIEGKDGNKEFFIYYRY